MNKINILVRSILAGSAISIAGMTYICSNNKIVGSLFFTVGLFLVLIYELNLFTGKICYALNNKLSYLFDLVVIWIGNLIGCVICGYLFNLCFTISFDVAAKLNNSPLQIFIKAIFCNICIYISVNGYKVFKEEWKRILSLFFGVSVFVLCGFEHCVADMFYVSYCNCWNLDSIIFILEVTAGNIVGGLLLSAIKKLKLYN